MKAARILLVFIVFMASCKSDLADQEAADVTNYHQKMRQELQRLVDHGDAADYYHWNLDRALAIVNTIPNVAGPENIQRRLNYGIELLNAGKTNEAIVNLEAIATDYQLNLQNVKPNNKLLFDYLALAYFRLGEQENCISRPSSGSCTLPISKENIYQFKAGSQKAIALLEPLLEKFPEDRTSRWLLNLAYMTLGQYPDQVPAKWLIPIPKNSTTPMFVEKASEKGAAIVGLSGGVIAEDFNNDGWIDIFCTSYGMQDSPKLLLNDQHGSFKDVSDQAGLEGLYGGLNCMQTDYNNDGLMDIFILRGAWLLSAGRHPNSLLENQGDGSFKDVSYKVGLTEAAPSQAAVWLDFDQDGWLDVFIGNESNGDDFPSRLYRNMEGKQFEEVTDKMGITIDLYVKGVVAGDIDNDGYPELYISNLKGKNRLLKNEKGKRFTDITQTAATAEPSSSFPCWFWDANQDGFQDLFVSSYPASQLDKVGGLYAAELLQESVDTEFPRYYINARDGSFIESSITAGLDIVSFGMGSNNGDVNNDGFADILIGNGSPNLNSVIPNRFFINRAGERFEEQSYESGLAHIQKGHGTAFADFDRDGDLDIYMVIGGAYEGDVFANAYYENQSTDLGNYISLQLTDRYGKRASIGTRVIVNATGEDGPKKFYANVSSGSSFGANPMELFIGIGEADTIESIDIHWAGSGSKQSINNPAINNSLKVQEPR